MTFATVCQAQLAATASIAYITNKVSVLMHNSEHISSEFGLTARVTTCVRFHKI